MTNWIQGIDIINKWKILPEELVALFHKEALVPWDRVENTPFDKNTIMELVINPLDVNVFKYDKEVQAQTLKRAFYKVEETLSVLSDNDLESTYSSPELEKIIDKEAIQVILLALENKERKKIAEILWPKEKYEPGNALHKKIGRRLNRGKEILNNAISQQTS